MGRTVLLGKAVERPGEIKRQRPDAHGLNPHALLAETDGSIRPCLTAFRSAVKFDLRVQGGIRRGTYGELRPRPQEAHCRTERTCPVQESFRLGWSCSNYPDTSIQDRFGK